MVTNGDKIVADYYKWQSSLDLNFIRVVDIC